MADDTYKPNHLPHVAVGVSVLDMPAGFVSWGGPWVAGPTSDLRATEHHMQLWPGRKRP